MDNPTTDTTAGSLADGDGTDQVQTHLVEEDGENIPQTPRSNEGHMPCNIEISGKQEERGYAATHVEQVDQAEENNGYSKPTDSSDVDGTILRELNYDKNEEELDQPVNTTTELDVTSDTHKADDEEQSTSTQHETKHRLESSDDDYSNTKFEVSEDTTLRYKDGLETDEEKTCLPGSNPSPHMSDPHISAANCQHVLPSKLDVVKAEDPKDKLIEQLKQQVHQLQQRCNTEIKQKEEKERLLDQIQAFVSNKLTLTDSGRNISMVSELEGIFQRLQDDMGREAELQKSDVLNDLRETKRLLQDQKEANKELFQKQIDLQIEMDHLKQKNHDDTAQLKKDREKLESRIQHKDVAIEQLQKDTCALKEERSNLTLRLSKLAGAQLTSNNPNIADLSDGNRPTMLAEKYSELYDNEWTDAFEECHTQLKLSELECVKMLLEFLKVTNAECVKLSQPLTDTLKNMTRVTVKVDKTPVSEVIPSSSNTTSVNSGVETPMHPKDAAPQTGVHGDDALQLGAPSHLKVQGENGTEEEPMDTSESNTGSANILQKTPDSLTEHQITWDETNTRVVEEQQANKVKVDVPMDLPFGFSTNVVTGEVTVKVEIDHEFTAELTKTILDLRKVCGAKLEETGTLSKIIATKVAFEKGIDPKTHERTFAYIARCAHVCWYMAIQDPPVVIGLPELEGDAAFEKDTYKAYTRGGKKLDFVVWPPLYLHKGGAMLSKGTAQGKT